MELHILGWNLVGSTFPLTLKDSHHRAQWGKMHQESGQNASILLLPLFLWCLAQNCPQIKWSFTDIPQKSENSSAPMGTNKMVEQGGRCEQGVETLCSKSASFLLTGTHGQGPRRGRDRMVSEGEKVPGPSLSTQKFSHCLAAQSIWPLCAQHTC